MYLKIKYVYVNNVDIEIVEIVRNPGSLVGVLRDSDCTVSLSIVLFL